jgi:prepilin-type N-terminal cleavage/methylation domain-containing protein
MTTPSRAFTLLEVLVAIALGAVLLAAVAGAIDLHRKYSFAGQECVEQDQLGRAILRDVESDVRALVYRGGLVGGSQWMILHVYLPDQLALPGATLHGDPVGLPTKSVGYAIAVNGQIRLPLVATKPLCSATTSGARLPADGLYRIEFSGPVAEKNGADHLPPAAHHAELLASDVRNFELRYFDGADWVATWDSTAMRGFPRAVEIILRLDSRSDSQVPNYELHRAPTANVYRSVIALPVVMPLRNRP